MNTIKHTLLSIRSYSTKNKGLRKMNDIFYGTTTTLNRFSFLRTNTDFINKCINDEFTSSKFVFYRQDGKNQMNPYTIHNTNEHSTFSLLLLQLLCMPLNLQDVIKSWCVKNSTGDPNIRSDVTCVFLGLDQDGDEVEQFISCGNSLTSTFKQPENVKFLNNLPVFKYENDGNTTYKGVPIFAIDVTNSIIFQEWLSGLANVGVSTSMSDTLTFTKNEASLFSYSKMYLDWLMRNQYCPGCGSKVIPIDSGTRLQCTGPPDTCPVKSTNVNNVCFPRTDPVIIVGIISNDGSKILLGHNKRHQPTSNGKLMYSCIAGFMEPGETIEEATIREIWEETGVKASKVKLIQSQPWPFPANLMIGCIGIVEFNNDFELINLEFDKELDVCKWFDCNDVLNHINGVDVDGLDHFMLPMSNSIAYQLILKSIKGELTN